MPNIDKIIGRRLKLRRELMGRTLAELAEALGITVGELAEIENGDRRLGSDLMTEACKVLDVLPTFFFTETIGTLGNGSEDRRGDD